MLWLTLFSKLEWDSYIISIVKTVSKNIGALIHSMKFLFPEVALYLYNFTIWPCMEYCFHIWAGAPRIVRWATKMDMQDCWSFTGCLSWTLAHPQNVASLSLFYRYLLDVHLNWLNWFHILIPKGGLLFILIDCIISLSPFLDVTRMSLSTVSFLAQLNSGIFCL